MRFQRRLWHCCKRCTPDGLFTRLLRCGCARSVTYNLYAPSLRAGTPCSHAKILSRRMGSWVSIRRIRSIRIQGLSGWVTLLCTGKLNSLNFCVLIMMKRCQTLLAKIMSLSMLILAAYLRQRAYQKLKLCFLRKLLLEHGEWCVMVT